MMEMKIKIEVPDLAAAVEKLAAAVTMPSAAPAALPPQMPTPAPATAPVMPQVPGPAAPANPTPAPTTAASVTAPGPSPAPVTTAPPMTGQAAPLSNAPSPGPAMPVAAAPAYTLDQISKAGASLVDAGKMEPLLALLTKYGVQAITQLQPAQYGVFATELRALGAQI